MRNMALIEENQHLHLENTALREALTLAVENIEDGQGLYVSHKPMGRPAWKLDNIKLISKLRRVLGKKF
jgi:regulator of replication initiation timing